jgi:serine/threonine-protein kinase HipA
MTPLYDILSMWPYFGDGPNQFRRKKAGLAMALRSKSAHYALDGIRTRHWHQLAAKNGGPRVFEAMLGLIERVGPALAAVEARLPAAFNAKTWDAISSGMRSQAERFRRGIEQLA